LALIYYYTRDAGGNFKRSEVSYYASPAEFIIARIPDGVPFRCYRGNIDITTDADAMCEDGEFSVIESAGGGTVGKILSPFSKFNDPLGFNRKLMDLIVPKAKDPSTPNQQQESPNNSLTDRNNKPRPYARVYDICGTVQSIPSDIMDGYNSFDANNKELSLNYYYAARSFIDTPANQITDGDTLLSAISGSGAAIYDPFTSPNNSAPRQIVGATFSEGIYISSRSNEVDGITLRAPNELIANVSDTTTVSLSGTSGTITDTGGDAQFDELFKIGDVVTVTNLTVSYPTSNVAVLDGTFAVQAVAETFITMDASSALVQWQRIPGGSAPIITGKKPAVAPESSSAGFTDWFTVSKVKPQRLLINIVAAGGMYREDEDGKKSTSATAEIQYQLLDANLAPYGPINSVSQTLTDRTADEIGMSIYVNGLPSSAVRVRARRSSNKDFEFEGSINDDIKFRDLYGQVRDLTPHYGDMTTVHTIRRQTQQAAAVKQPQLKMVVTEMLYKYLGGGVFDSVRTPNTQAAQSLIRLLRDPLIGNLTLTAENMDSLLATQAEIEAYFGNPLAGQFCYTFDDSGMTAQDTFDTIAAAIFCTIDRRYNDVRLSFEKPQDGPAMLFTHRSKAGQETWSRSFNTRDAYDSLEFSYIDPKTNIKETLRLPPEGGVKTNKIDSKGIRNYQQAYWLAHRARQKDLLRRITVDFSATEEGVYALPTEAIGVVKGSRVATYDGYVIAQSGLTLTLSQEVVFMDGDQHFIQLKKRDGSVESVQVDAGANARQVIMLSTPLEPIYTGNDATKTEFSFGSEARHMAQMIVPATVVPSPDKTVKITGYNYDPDYYLFDNAQPIGGSFSNGFSNGFNI
jgi:hypothetical protein